MRQGSCAEHTQTADATACESRNDTEIPYLIYCCLHPAKQCNRTQRTTPGCNTSGPYVTHQASAIHAHSLHHSLTHLTHFLTHSLIHSLTHSLAHSTHSPEAINCLASPDASPGRANASCGLVPTPFTTDLRARIAACLTALLPVGPAVSKGEDTTHHLEFTSVSTSVDVWHELVWEHNHRCKAKG